MRLAVDTCILGKICHPAARANREVSEWFNRILTESEHEIYIPQIVDYELRREYLRMVATGTGGQVSLERLDLYVRTLEFLILDPDTMKIAAQNWATARSKGLSTDHEKSLDGDVILAAQAISVKATVVTENIKHLSRYVDSKTWQEIDI